MEIELSQDTQDTLDRYNVAPLWKLERDDLGNVRDDLSPELWKWDHLREAAAQIAADIPTEDLPPDARGVTVPVNTAYSGALSHTLFVGIKTVTPGEAGAAHRHGGNVLRFGIDGNEGLTMTVGGEAFTVTENDLVTIPQWEWHQHRNESDEELTWLEVTDVPLLVDGLNLTPPFEMHDEGRQADEHPSGYFKAQYGDTRPREARAAVSGPFEGIREATPPYRFPWADVETSLAHAATPDRVTSDSYRGTTVEYTNPARGSEPLFPTFTATVQRLEAGAATQAHHHNATEVYYVVTGSGQTTVDGATMDWTSRDIFVVPPSQTHSHNPDGDATLLALTDRPLLEAINFYHESSVG